MTVSDLFEWVVPAPEACRVMAASLISANPGRSPEQVARKAVANAKKWAAGAGAITGVFSNPFAIIPATGVDASAVLRIEGRMAGVIAAILEPASLANYEQFSADVMTVVFPGAASQTLRGLGVRASQGATKVLIRKYISKDVLKTLVRLALKYLGLRLTQKAIISKTVPVVGGIVGAAWNWIEVERVGRRAMRYYRCDEATDETDDAAEGGKPEPQSGVSAVVILPSSVPLLDPQRAWPPTV